MRSWAQLSATPIEWKRVQRAERERALAEVLALLAGSREEPWYRWIVEEWAPRRKATAR